MEKKGIELNLEQHGFELRESTSTQILVSKYYSTTWSEVGLMCGYHTVDTEGQL